MDSLSCFYKLVDAQSGEKMRMLKKLIWIGLLGFAALFISGESQAGDIQAENLPKRFLIHVKTSLDKDDAQICVAPNVALAALRKGDEVTLLFDGSAVTSVKRGSLFSPDKTAMDKAELPARERRALAEQFEIPLEKIPHDYGEYLGFLKQKGAKLLINRTMMLLYKIEPDEIDSNLSPISLDELVETIKEADVYIAY